MALKSTVVGKINKGQEILGIGVFDGVHIGHQKISDRCTSVLTFDPHPLTVIRQTPVSQLTTPQEMAFFASNVLTLPFDQDVANMAPQDFLDHIIWEQIQPKEIVVGYDFKFGAKQAGTLPVLHEWCISKDITLTVVEAVESLEYGCPVKSSVVRHALELGDFTKAIKFLGHPYVVSGTVVKGDGRGKGLGFPTANIRVQSENKLIPKSGVYAGYSKIEHINYELPSMIYIGNKPTFKGQVFSFEVHILKESLEKFLNQPESQPFVESSFSIYDATLHVFMTDFVRPEQTFESKEALVKQITQDIQNTASVFSKIR